MMLQGTALHSLFILKKILEKGTILDNRYLVIVIGVLVDPKLEERRMKIIENICLPDRDRCATHSLLFFFKLLTLTGWAQNGQTQADK